MGAVVSSSGGVGAEARTGTGWMIFGEGDFGRDCAEASEGAGAGGVGVDDAGAANTG